MDKLSIEFATNFETANLWKSEKNHSFSLEPLHPLFLMWHTRNVESSCNNLKVTD